MATAFHAGYQHFGIDTLDRGLTGRVDRRYKYNIGVIKCLLKIIHMVAQSGKTVRLRNRDHPALGALTRCRQNSTNLNGVMPVIIDNGDAFNLANIGKASFYPAEFVKTVLDFNVRHPHLKPDRDGGQGILNVMAPWHRQFDTLDSPLRTIARAHDHIEAIATRKRHDILTTYIGLC